jgi:hypothetical protein
LPQTTAERENKMKIQKYLDELEDQNWHSLYTLVQLQQGQLEGQAAEHASMAMECAIAYLHWTQGYYSGMTYLEAIADRLSMDWDN